MRTDDGGHEYEESVRGERKKRLRSILKTVGTGGDEGARIPRLYKNTKTFYKPESYPCTDVSRYKGEKDGKVQKARMDDCRE
jgi:hypothetical protein